VCLIRTENALCDAPCNAQSECFPRTFDSVDGLLVFITGIRTRLEPFQSILDNCQQVVIEDTGGASLYGAGAVLELNLAHLFWASVLDAVSVGAVPGFRVALVQRSDV
jgi:hypothetical protein